MARSFSPAALYHMDPCTQHEAYDPIPTLHAMNASLEWLEAALDIAEVSGTDAWAHGPMVLLYLDNMHFTMFEWLEAHRDWSIANIWLKEALARRQADGRIQGYEFLLKDPEMIAFLNGDETTRVYR